MVSRRRTFRARVGIAGLGYMGLATGLAFAARGAQVVGYDSNPQVRESVAAGRSPYREPGLAPLLRAHVRGGGLEVVDSADGLVARSEGLFLCVPTPSRGSGRIDLRPLEGCVREIGGALRRAPKSRRVVVVKSTVVPGTTEQSVAPWLGRASGWGPDLLGVAANPEFLAEGSMVEDALRPARIVIGTTQPWVETWLRNVYRPFRSPVSALTPSGAELVKYASNGFLAIKVSFADELARMADRLGEDVDRVVAAVGSDPRIGPHFLRAGPGFGGSCFGKDLRALVARSREWGIRFRTGEAALRANEEQLEYAFGRVRGALGDLSDRPVALLGLAFKAGTDDVRESRALLLAERLVEAGAIVRAHDPAASDTFRRAWFAAAPAHAYRLTIVPTVEDALTGVDGAILQAEWPEYRRWSRRWTRLMRVPRLVDLRRFLEPGRALRAGLTVTRLGAPSVGRPGADGGGRIP